MELSGVINGLKNLKTKSDVNVFTDSQYTINRKMMGKKMERK
jgi:ribonuclease HI